MEKNRAASIPNSPIGYGILLSLITFLALLLAAEIAFRFTPVCDSVYSTTTTAADTVYRCRPNREVFLSAFWNFAMQNKVRVNNAGFVSDLAFDADDPRPLLAVVGDSYVEALWVPWPESLAGRLHQALSPDYRVYAISKSGSPMSQYLVYAQFARDTYQPAALVVVIIDNDFDQSLPRYKHN
nr:hypothetical protein [Calditrichia bacterium]